MRKLKLPPLVLAVAIAVILTSLVTVGCSKEAVEEIARQITPSEMHFGAFFAPFLMTEEDWKKWGYQEDSTGDMFYAISTDEAGYTPLHVDITHTSSAVLNLSSDNLDQLRGSTFFPNGGPVNGRLAVGAHTPAPATDGEWAVFALQVGETLPQADSDHSVTFAATFDHDGNPDNNFTYFHPYDWDIYQGTDLWYELNWCPDLQQWQLYVSYWVVEDEAPQDIASASWAVIDGDIVVFFIPVSEFGVPRPAYQMSTFVTDGSWEPGASGMDCIGAYPMPLPPQEVAEEPIRLGVKLTF